MRKTLILFMIFFLVLMVGCSALKKIIMPREDGEKPAGELTDSKVQVEEKTTVEGLNITPSAAPAQEPKPVQGVTPAQEAERTPEPTPAPKAAPAPNPTPSPTPVAEKETSSSSAYSVRVDISDQKVYVYREDEVVKAMVCSTGIEEEGKRTPRGEYIINESGKKRGEWFYEPKFQQGAKYWVGFIGGNFLFHSVPMDEDKNIIENEAEKLGSPASHGCIRLSIDDAYWFYKTIPSGTKLIIED